MEINGNHYIDVSHEETVMGFAASCVEHVARKVGKDYRVVYDALKRHNAFEDYIVRFYDCLHTMSWDYVEDDILEYLNVREDRLC